MQSRRETIDGNVVSERYEIDADRIKALRFKTNSICLFFFEQYDLPRIRFDNRYEQSGL